MFFIFTHFILVDFPIHIDTMGMDLSILCFKGSLVKLSKLLYILSLKIFCFVLPNQTVQTLVKCHIMQHFIWHFTVLSKYMFASIINVKPGRVAQSVTCLTTDARSRLCPILSWRLFMKLFLWSADSFKKGRELLSVTSESMCTNY